MLNSLVCKLHSEGRPSRIKYRLCHGGFSESGGTNVTYRDVIKLTYDAGTEFVVKIVTAIRNLCLYCFRSSILVGALSDL